MAISRMQNPQQLQGIGSLRQPYGLGKLVKKAFKGVKKIAKSPLGKAALIGGLGMIPFGGQSTWGRLGGMLAKRGVTGGGGIGKFFKSGLGRFVNPWSGAFGDKGAGVFNPKHAFGLLGAGAVAAPFIQSALKMGPYEEEEEVIDDWTQTPSSIANIRQMARLQDPSLAFLPSSNYVQSGFYAADGGRAGLLNGGEAGKAQMEQMLRAEYMKYRNRGGTMPYEQFKILVMKQSQQGQMPNQMMAADGGRARYAFGEEVEQETDFIQGPQGNEEFSETVVEEVGATDQQKAMVMDMLQRGMDHATIAAVTGLEESDVLSIMQETQAMATGGRAGFQYGGSDDDDELTYNPYQAMDMYKRTRRQEGGLMDLGGQEKDYRDEGGFVALGGEERADDVPARLSKNEFVFTADAVRNAGGGDIDAGSEVMQNVMDNLEAGGEISEESQGLEGGEEIMSEEIIDESNPAQEMYDNYEQLQSRVA